MRLVLFLMKQRQHKRFHCFKENRIQPHLQISRPSILGNDDPIESIAVYKTDWLRRLQTHLANCPGHRSATLAKGCVCPTSKEEWGQNDWYKSNLSWLSTRSLYVRCIDWMKPSAPGPQYLQCTRLMGCFILWPRL